MRIAKTLAGLAMMTLAAIAPFANAEESAWKREFDAAWNDAQDAEGASRWADAAAAYERVKALVPFECLTRFNLARMYAKLDRRGDALIALNEAVEYGWCDGARIRNEAAFSPYIRDDDFRKVLSRAAEIMDERFVFYTPANLDKAKPAPLIVVLHGRGETPQGTVPYWRKAADELGCAVVVPRGVTQRGSCLVNTWDAPPPTSKPASQAASKPTDANKANGTTSSDAPIPAPGDLAEIDLEASRKCVDIAITFSRQFATLDNDRIVLAGFSQGGAVALRLAAAQPERFAGVLNLGGLYNTADAPRWKDVAANKPLRVVLLAGALDSLRKHSERAAADLKAAGIDTKLEMIEQTGHEPPADWAQRQTAALRHILHRD